MALMHSVGGSEVDRCNNTITLGFASLLGRDTNAVLAGVELVQLMNSIQTLDSFLDD
jgi:hypothetical protein